MIVLNINNYIIQLKYNNIKSLITKNINYY